MEESQGSPDASTGLEDREAPAPLDVGRLGGVLCQLQRARFDGILHIESGARSASIGFRAGVPVTFDDPAQGHMLGDQFVERGQLTRAQCNTVIARMTDGIVEDEAVAFCEHAVQLGFLTEEAANVELSSRIRARMIQLLALHDCTTSLEPGEAALFGRREFPQDIGAIVYMGVRTFYDEDLLARCHPELPRTYLRLLAAPASIAHFFGLDDEEFKLLRRISPEQPVSLLLEDRRVDPAHLLSLLLLLRLADFCEVASVPFPKTARLGRPGARPSVPASVSPEPVATRAEPHAPPIATSETPAALPIPPAPRPTAVPTVDATQEALLEAAARTARMRRPPPGPLRRNSMPAEQPPASSKEPSASAAPSGAASNLRPGADGQPAPKDSAAPQPQQVRPEYAKAHLQELIARRKHTAAVAASEAPAPTAVRDPARELREARAQLHAQQFGRAEKILAGLIELDATNDVYKIYHLWARWRAQPEAADNLTEELQSLAKKLLPETEHAAFSAYVLGHVFFHLKRDDLAEKFFKRAQSLDRNNKDAERHLLILERRKHAAADSAAGANRKIFGIPLSGPKPKS
jgi:hypothetical protein